MSTRSGHVAWAAVPCHNDHSDLDLLRRIAAHDPHAFEMLYHQYERRLAAYLTTVLGPSTLVEEVLHDVLLAVWQQAPTYQPTGRVSAWIFGIAHHNALKARTTVARQGPQRCPARPAVPAEATPEEDLLHQEDVDAVATALAALRPEQRAVVELTYYHQCSYQEIAALLDCPENTVKTRMWQARRHLVTHLTRLGLVSPRSSRRQRYPDPRQQIPPSTGFGRRQDLGQPMQSLDAMASVPHGLRQEE